MTSNTLETSALYDPPGTKTRRRRLTYGTLSTLLLLGLFAWILHLLFVTDRFTSTQWTPFAYQGLRGPLLRGLPALVAGLTLHNGSVLAEVFRSGVHFVDRGEWEAAFALGMRRTQVMSYVIVPGAVRAVLPAVVSQLGVALQDTSLGFLVTCQEFLHAGKLIASNLDYDLPFIPVVTVISPICIGMCMLLSRFAPWAARRERRSSRTEAVGVAPAEPGTLLPGGTPTPWRRGGVQ